VPALGEAQPAPSPALAEEITVTATGVESRLADVPAAVTVLDRDELDAAPALALDDVLRQVPGFTLFRRSGSRTANPTTQGPSLRGVGGSGASRALVLGDGIPLNDPFGGWVAWARVPRLALQRVEVLRGGASDLYGTGALTGVIQLLRRPIVPGAWAAEASAGNQSTASADLWSAARRGGWGGSLAAERLTTEGAVPVAPDERGAVDVAAGGHQTSVELTVERSPISGASSAGARSRLFARGSSFEERRFNGTPQQTNSTWMREAALGADVPALGGDAALRLWATRERYFQTFSVVAADRDSEVKNRDQRVPSRVRGASARWTRPLAGGATLLAGLEERRTRGSSDERLFTNGRIVASSSGGRQDLEGAYVEALLAPAPRWSFAAGLRGDGWRNVSNPGSGGAPPGVRERRDAQALSPRLSARFQAGDSWALDLAGYRSFRAPTLNELYRGFRVGNVVTDPNPRLGPERLRGAELGIGWTPRTTRAARVRASLFSMDLEDSIANVTISSTPELVRRRRENLGRTRARGVELEGEAQPWRRLGVAGSWLLVDSTVRSFAADAALVGKRVPQVPRAQASLSFSWRGDATNATVAGRWSAGAFEDDRNTAALDRFTLVDAELGRRLHPGLTVFVAVENLFDEEYVVGRAGVTTVGTPRLLRVGVRFSRGGP